MSVSSNAILPPETLLERVTNAAARGRDGVYLAISWNTTTASIVRERIHRLLSAEGWLNVSESVDSLMLYGTGVDIELRQLRAKLVEAVDGSQRGLSDFCSLELRSPASATSRSDRLQRSILANLDAIFATQGIGLSVDLKEWPRVACSVVNFGVELPIGAGASTDSLRRFEAAISKAIRRFEPRLAPDTLTVEIVDPESAFARGALHMSIVADLKSAYGNKGVRFRTLIDLQTGRTTTEEESANAGRNAQSV
jgi:type VI secretion system protein ImpF